MVLVWRSKNRLAGFMVGILVAIAGWMAAPEEYKERIYSISEYETEGSAQGRLRAWGIAINMAKSNPVFGVGLGKFGKNYLKYAENPTPGELDGSAIIVAHSSYLQIWSECGTPAFLLYFTLIGSSFYTIWRIRRKASRRYYSSWMLNYCTMFEASLVTFMVGATFLNRAHFDLFYHWVALIMVFGHVADKDMEDAVLHPVKEGTRGPIRSLRSPGFAPRPAFNAFAREPAVRED
jgi:O-antigen ligase